MLLLETELNDRVNKNVFLAVMGTSPAVLTESIYYYIQQAPERRMFSEIKLLTTSLGKQVINTSLFEDHIWQRLLKDLKLSPEEIPFSESDIIVFSNPKTGKPLGDLISSEDNSCAANLINHWVKHFTDDDGIKLTATVAGGRKTQGVLMALAFQLYGRQQDQLIHVMAPQELMDDPDWFYPSDPSDPDQKVSISNIPILKVGRYISRRSDQSPDQLIEEIQESLVAGQPIQAIVITKNIFVIDGIKIRIPPREASYFRYFLKRRASSSCCAQCPGCNKCCSDQDTLLQHSRTEILHEHLNISGESGHYLRPQAKRQNTSDLELIPAIYEEVSKLGSSIRNSELHPLRREDIAPKKVHLHPGNKKEVAYGIIIDPSIIHFE